MLLFLFCSFTKEELDENRTNLDNFGESMLWAGCTIIHILGQRNRFEMLDFLNYLIKLDEIDQFEKSKEPEDKKKKSKSSKSTEANLLQFDEQKRVKFFIGRAIYVYGINNYIFSILEAHYDTPERYIQIFHPTGAEPELQLEDSIW